MKLTKDLVSAVKRKDMKEVVAAIVAEHDLEKAEEVKKASRLTVALIDRTLSSLVPTVEVETVEVETVEVVETEVVEEAANEIDNQFKDLDKLIAKGKKKKAKKLYEAMVESGLKGSEIDKRKKQIKEL